MAQTKVIVIKGDTKQAQASFESLTKTIQEQKDITIEFEVELRKLEAQLLNTSKANTSRQKELNKRIGNLKNSLKDQRVSLKSLNNERTKANKVTKTSIESVTRNYGAIQILDQFTGGLATQVRSATDASKLFNKSLFAQKKALIATGIGALVVALGLIVAYWDDIVDFITQANKSLESNLALNIKVQESLNSQLSLVDSQLELNKLQGKANEELQKQKVQILKSLKTQSALERDILKSKLAELKIEQKQISFFDRVKDFAAFRLGGSKALGEADKQKQIDDLAAINALEAQITAAEKKAIDLEIVLFNLNNPKGKDGKREQVGGVSGNLQQIVDEEEKRRAQLQIDLLAGLDEDGLQAGLDRKKFFADQEAEIKKKQLDDELGYANANAKAREQLAGATLNILGGLAEEGSALSKGVAISQAVISTYAGINKALAETTDFTPTQSLRFANAAAVGIAGLLNVKKILSTDTVGASANVSAGRGGTPVPSFNVVEGSEGSQITNAINNQDKVSRAFVVSSDVSTSQELDRNIVSNSRL